jgi:hypothetical protein
LVYWYIGILVYWYIGILVYWYIGILVYWYIGILVYLGGGVLLFITLFIFAGIKEIKVWIVAKPKLLAMTAFYYRKCSVAIYFWITFSLRSS